MSQNHSVLCKLLENDYILYIEFVAVQHVHFANYEQDCYCVFRQDWLFFSSVTIHRAYELFTICISFIFIDQCILIECKVVEMFLSYFLFVSKST